MSDSAPDSNKSINVLVIQFSFSICVVLALLTWIFDVSFWKSITIALSALLLILLYAVIFLLQRVERLEKSRQYRLTRIYNKKGQEVMNRWTDQINSGHWVTITTDVLNHDVLYAEHTRTDENTNTVGRENCIREDHEYNRSAVWGEHYKGPEYKIQIKS
jgi:hypothetical protein